MVSGCQVPRVPSALPGEKELVREQLVVKSDFTLPQKHRLLDELTLRRSDIATRLDLPVSDEPINVYLFKDEVPFREYMRVEFPDFKDRRALFVKDDTNLRVIAHWGPHVGVDLRHEVTHGYLHSVVPNLPLWLDEGIAEYFETPRGKQGVNYPHVYLLSKKFRQGKWQPDLQQLERSRRPADFSQLQYAESWLWIHFLIESNSGNREMLQKQLKRLRMTGQAPDMSYVLDKADPHADAHLLEHLKRLAEAM
ncbi:MAG: DUF1570 domain-containing protein [Mariniblastus sp.]|nr:DUF1570 domain-containing protein [Mariniblastus sp.]